MTTATEARQTYGPCLVKNLREAAFNPRRHFDDKQLADLVESIKAVGILTPLLVRPFGDEEGVFEIVGGARRFRAAKLAGLKEVPVIARNLSDHEALELAVIDNLQRADVHPLDEAEGYKALLEQPGYDVAAIAAKVGKSPSYVYQRLKLADLIEPVKRAFWEEKLSFGHAILLARLQEADQLDAVEECFHERGPSWKRKRTEIISVRELDGWIHDNVILNLSGAPWKKDDAELVPAAGPCTTCPKRTGNCLQLFPEVSNKDLCTDRECFRSKADAFVSRRIAEQEAKGHKVIRISTSWQSAGKAIGTDSYRSAVDKKACKATVLGIFVDGPKRGSVTTVCTDRTGCKTHRESSGYSSGSGTRGRTPAEEKKHQAELHKERIRVRARTLIYKATVEAIDELDRPLLNAIADDMVGAVYGDDFDAVYPKCPDVGGLKPKDLARVMAAAYLARREDAEILDEAKRQSVPIPTLQKLAKDQCDAGRDHKERIRKWKGRVAAQAKSFPEATCAGCGCTATTACVDPTLLRACSWIKLNEKSNAGTCSACAETDEK